MPNNLPQNYQPIVFNQQIYSCRLATTGNMNGTLTPANNTNGVGTTLINAGALAVLSIDSTICVVGDRILVVAQTNQSANGVYVVTDAGSSVAPWIMTRAPDWCTFEQIVLGQYTTIEDGATLKGKHYTFVAPYPLQINVDSIIFIQA